MSQSTHIAAIESLLESARAVYCFSGYQVYAECKGEVVDLSGGTTGYWPGAVPVTSATWFDIGSVTKSVCTASLIALGVQERKFALDMPLVQMVPALHGTKAASIPLKAVLTHCAGFVGWRPLFKELAAEGPETAWRTWFQKRAPEFLLRPPFEKTEYSDIGFILLGLAVEHIWGNLNASFQSRVVGPLGLREIAFGPISENVTETVAATEYCLNRRKLLVGEVFDENTAAFGGTSGHAGLFATARGLAPFARAWCESVKRGTTWLGKPTAEAFVRRGGLVPGSTWALGWDTKSETNSSAGSRFSPTSFGHLGYPGCSIWIDPEREGWVIFLSNRVHPSRFDERIRKIRPKLHDAIAALWDLRNAKKQK